MLFNVIAATTALAQCPPTVPVEGAAPPGPLPVLPSDNWCSTIGIESDGVDYATHQGVPFYPIPAHAIMQPH